MMKRYFFLLLLCVTPLLVPGQSNALIEKMRKERIEMEEQIAQQEKILMSTESNISNQVSNLNIISAKLKERIRLLDNTVSEIRLLDIESSRIEKQIAELEKEQEQCKERYADACSQCPDHGEWPWQPPRHELLGQIGAENVDSGQSDEEDFRRQIDYDERHCQQCNKRPIAKAVEKYLHDLLARAAAWRRIRYNNTTNNLS